MAANDFGKLLRLFRLSRGYGLRQFAEKIHELPSNLSAIEQGRRKAWLDPEKLRKAAEELALTEGSRDWDRFFQAARQPGRTRPDIDFERLMEMEIFPVLCRTLNDARLTKQEMRDLVEYIKQQRNLRTNGAD